eukprot:Gb_11174 [translate_table: standard]
MLGGWRHRTCTFAKTPALTDRSRCCPGRTGGNATFAPFNEPRLSNRCFDFLFLPENCPGNRIFKDSLSQFLASGSAHLIALSALNTLHIPIASNLEDGEIRVFQLVFCLLPNGDFEEGPKPSSLKGTVIIGRASLPNWQIKGLVEYISSRQKQDAMLLVVPHGGHAVRLGNEGQIRQRIKVEKGSFYALTFSAARTCAQFERLKVSVPPLSGQVPMQTVYSSKGWDAYAWGFKAASEIVDVILHNPGTEDHPACGPLIDSVAIKELFPPEAAKYNLVKNGDFEEGPYMFHNGSTGVLLPPNTDDSTSPLPGWVIESHKAVKYIDSAHFAVPQGMRAVELLAGKESVIAQIIRTAPGRLYNLSFAVGDARNTCKGSMVVEAFAGKETFKVPYESKGTGSFKSVAFKFIATASTTRIAFLSTFYTMRSDDFSSLCGPVVDQVNVVAHY